MSAPALPLAERLTQAIGLYVCAISSQSTRKDREALVEEIPRFVAELLAEVEALSKPKPITDAEVEAAARELCVQLKADSLYTDDDGEPLADEFDQYTAAGKIAWLKQARAILNAARRG